MELVTLAQVELNRIGTASFAARKSFSKIMEVADGHSDTLRETVINIAAEHGESADRLQLLRQVNARTQGAIAFDIQDPMRQYSDVYANCLAYPALKVGERYFKLQEIEIK